MVDVFLKAGKMIELQDHFPRYYLGEFGTKNFLVGLYHM